MMSSDPSSRSRLTAVALMLIAVRTITTVSAVVTVSRVARNPGVASTPMRCRNGIASPPSTPAATNPQRPSSAAMLVPRSWLSRHAIGLLPTRIASRPSTGRRCVNRRHHGVRTVREPSPRTANALVTMSVTDMSSVSRQYVRTGRPIHWPTSHPASPVDGIA